MEKWTFITNIIFSLALAVFACLQWMAVAKQNRQNLFTLRIELYGKINDIVWKILFAFMDLKEGNKEAKHQTTSNICWHYLELTHNLIKVKHLFNEEIKNSLDAFVKTSAEYNSQAQQREDFENINFADVFQKSDDLKTVFEDFFNKNTI